MKMCVPFLAVAGAGVANVMLIRRNEMTDGIDVMDEDGKVYGKSQAAGRNALMEVGLTRVVLPAPVLVLPGLIMWVFIILL